MDQKQVEITIENLHHPLFIARLVLLFHQDIPQTANHARARSVLLDVLQQWHNFVSEPFSAKRKQLNDEGIRLKVIE